MQEVLVYITLVLSIGYIIKKYFFKSKSKGCDTGCDKC